MSEGTAFFRNMQIYLQNFISEAEKRTAVTIRIAYVPSKNVLPRTRVPRPQHAPQRFNRVHTVSRRGRGCPSEMIEDSICCPDRIALRAAEFQRAKHGKYAL